MLGFGAVCHLIASTLAYWAVFTWTPGLFHCLLGSVPESSSLALGPKDACSLLHLLVCVYFSKIDICCQACVLLPFMHVEHRTIYDMLTCHFHKLFVLNYCILQTLFFFFPSLFLFFFLRKKGDLFPEEGIWVWCNGMPPLCALRALSIGTILGPEADEYVDWFLQPEHLKIMLVRLTSQLSRIGQIVLNFAFSVRDLVLLIRRKKISPLCYISMFSQPAYVSDIIL